MFSVHFNKANRNKDFFIFILNLLRILHSLPFHFLQILMLFSAQENPPKKVSYVFTSGHRNCIPQARLWAMPSLNRGYFYAVHLPLFSARCAWLSAENQLYILLNFACCSVIKTCLCCTSKSPLDSLARQPTQSSSESLYIIGSGLVMIIWNRVSQFCEAFHIQQA